MVLKEGWPLFRGSFIWKHEGKGSKEIIIIIITTRHASWPIGQQRSSSTPVCHWPAAGWCPSCSSCPSFLLPQFFARLPSVDHTSAFPLGSCGLFQRKGGLKDGWSSVRDSCTWKNEGKVSGKVVLKRFIYTEI